MNPDSPIDPIESSLTALLLGELPHEQAAALHQKLTQDVDLAKLYERLKQTINLVRETVASPAAQTAHQPTPLKLSDQRRQKLLQHFKTVTPKEFAPPRRSVMSWLVPVASTAALVLILSSLLLPTLSNSSSKSKGRNHAFRTSPGSELAASAPLEPPLEREGELAASAPPEPNAAKEGIITFGLGGNGRTQLPILKSENHTAGLPASPPGEVLGEPAKPTGTVIVLPQRSELADAAMAPPVAEGLKPRPASVSSTQPGATEGQVQLGWALNVPSPPTAIAAASSLGVADQPAGSAPVLGSEGEPLPPRQMKTPETSLLSHRQSTDDKSKADAYAAATRELADDQLTRKFNILEENKDAKAYQTGKAAVASPKTALGRADLRPGAVTGTTETGAKASAAAPAPVPQPEVETSDNAFSTFSLNVSDVSFKLAAASLEKSLMPEPATVRSEEFINAFDYRDPEPPQGVPVAFAWEQAQYPFAQNRDLLRFSIKTAALGRQPGRPLNIVLLLDNSGSMERADRVRIIREALRVLAGQLQPQDKFSVVTFSRTAHLWVDGVSGSRVTQVAEDVGGLTPQGGTNLEDAMNLGYQTALRHYLANGVNRIVLLTDGAANLGNVNPEALKQKVEAHRKQGIAFDCFGIGWEGYNDDLLEALSRNGDGRYGFVNTPEEAATEFATKLAGALQVAASDVKVQVEFNPGRVTAYRQIGYAKHQLTKEQFRDNTVDAAEIGAAESGNALYTVQINPAGTGPLCTVRVRFRIPGTADYREHAWDVPFTGNALPLEQGSPAMRLAATASALSEWLASSPYAGEVTPDRLLSYLRGVPQVYGADARPKKLEWMIRQTKSITGK